MGLLTFESGTQSVKITLNIFAVLTVGLFDGLNILFAGYIQHW